MKEQKAIMNHLLNSKYLFQLTLFLLLINSNNYITMEWRNSNILNNEWIEDEEAMDIDHYKYEKKPVLENKNELIQEFSNFNNINQQSFTNSIYLNNITTDNIKNNCDPRPIQILSNFNTNNNIFNKSNINTMQALAYKFNNSKYDYKEDDIFHSDQEDLELENNINNYNFKYNNYIIHTQVKKQKNENTKKREKKIIEIKKQTFKGIEKSIESNEKKYIEGEIFNLEIIIMQHTEINYDSEENNFNIKNNIKRKKNEKLSSSDLKKINESKDIIAWEILDKSNQNIWIKINLKIMKSIRSKVQSIANALRFYKNLLNTQWRTKEECEKIYNYCTKYKNAFFKIVKYFEKKRPQLIYNLEDIKNSVHDSNKSIQKLVRSFVNLKKKIQERKLIIQPTLNFFYNKTNKILVDKILATIKTAIQSHQNLKNAIESNNLYVKNNDNNIINENFIWQTKEEIKEKLKIYLNSKCALQKKASKKNTFSYEDISEEIDNSQGLVISKNLNYVNIMLGQFLKRWKLALNKTKSIQGIISQDKNILINHKIIKEEASIYSQTKCIKSKNSNQINKLKKNRNTIIKIASEKKRKKYNKQWFLHIFSSNNNLKKNNINLLETNICSLEKAIYTINKIFKMFCNIKKIDNQLKKESIKVDKSFFNQHKEEFQKYFDELNELLTQAAGIFAIPTVHDSVFQFMFNDKEAIMTEKENMFNCVDSMLLLVQKIKILFK